jgi:hypothetical protein
MRAKFLQALGLSVLALTVTVLTACNRHAESRHPDARPAAVPVTIAMVTNVAWGPLGFHHRNACIPRTPRRSRRKVDGSVERTLVDFGDRVKTEPGSGFHRHGLVCSATDPAGRQPDAGRSDPGQRPA